MRTSGLTASLDPVSFEARGAPEGAQPGIRRRCALGSMVVGAQTSRSARRCRQLVSHGCHVACCDFLCITYHHDTYRARSAAVGTVYLKVASTYGTTTLTLHGCKPYNNNGTPYFARVASSTTLSLVCNLLSGGLLSLSCHMAPSISAHTVAVAVHAMTGRPTGCSPSTLRCLGTSTRTSEARPISSKNLAVR